MSGNTWVGKQVRDIFSHRELVMTLAVNDFKKKYAGSYLGIIWAFVQPIITILVYWFVFEKGLRAGAVSGDIPFIVWLLIGLIPWFFFSDAIANATVCYLEYNYLVKKVLFKIGILPFVKIISALFVHLFFVFFAIVFLMFKGFLPNIMYLQLLYYSICLIVFIQSLALITSSIQPFITDLNQVIAIILQVLFWLTPILWSEDILSDNLEFLFKLNPLYYIVSGYRDSLIYGVGFWEKPNQTIYFWIVSLVLTAIGYKTFKKLKSHFADVL